MNKHLQAFFSATLLGCSVCFMANAQEKVDGVYQISSASDLVGYSALVADGDNSPAVLTADIDMSDVSFTPIGNEDAPFRGVFDGQCHYVRNLEIASSSDYQGLFGVVADGAHIKNVIMDENCYIMGRDFCGGIAGGSKGSGIVTIENSGNEGSVTATGANAAGIIGVSKDGRCGFILINCFNTGKINGNRDSAGLTGWVGPGTVIRNCYNSGDIKGMDGKNSLYRNSCSVYDCFDIFGYQGAIIYEDELSTGAAAYKMNANGTAHIWYQTLGEDSHPIPFATHGTVYALGHLNCDGTPAGGVSSGYSNTDESERDPHSYVDGICTVCGDIDTEFIHAGEDGFYALSTPAHLNWFAAMVNKGSQSLNARLTADIDFSMYTEAGVSIAKEENYAYLGVFDGNEHKININYDSNQDGTALFGFLKSATIRNLFVGGSINTTARFAGGLFSVSRGATLIENCVSAVNITSSYSGDATHGGFASNTHNNIIFRNCAYVGKMDAPSSEGSAGIIGYAHGAKEILLENVYVGGELNLGGNKAVFARNNPQYSKCYYTSFMITASEAELVDAETLSSGELCYILNNYSSGPGEWSQTLGTDAYPLPFTSHDAVYATGSVNCDGKPEAATGYSNIEGALVHKDHNFVDGICENCGGRHITTAGQLVALAEDINSGEAPANISVTLGNDIDMSGITAYPCIGTREHPFSGTFNGNNHRILNMIIESFDEGNKGLFGVITGGADISNVIIDSSCDIYSIGYSAGIAGATKGRGLIRISNCGNEANVAVEGPNAAGILGVDDLGDAMIRISNCYNTGDISGKKECAAISGWLGTRSVVSNCYNMGEVMPNCIDGDRTFARGDYMTLDNCYEYDVFGRQVNLVSLEAINNGELCYLLNGEKSDSPVFFQTLNSDNYPVLDPTHAIVYLENGKYVNTLTSIDTVPGTDTPANPTDIWSVSGTKRQSLQRGLNVVKYSDGSVRKIIVK